MLLNKLRHCHSVFLGWAFPTALINGVDWSRYFSLMGLGIFFTAS